MTPNPLVVAKALLGRDPSGALAAARSAHRANATLETTLLLATASRRVGDPAAAVALLTPLADTAARAWGVQYELGIALAATGNETGAIAALERALTANPRATGPRHALRDLRLLAGEPAADSSIAALCDPALQSAVADFLDQREGASETLLRRFGLDCRDVAAACLIAEIGLALGRGAAVAALLAGATAYRPARLRLAEALHRDERDAEGLAALSPAFDENPPVIVRALRGAMLLRTGREEEAVVELACVAEIEPERPTAHLALAHALRAVGRRDAAIAAYRAALALDPMLAEAWYSIADLKVAAFGNADIAAMEKLAANPDLPAMTRAQIGFALGRAREDAGDYSRAFAHYEVANALRRSIEPYDESAHQHFVAATIGITDPAFFAARAGSGNPDPGPIFVVGMPRSGTTLVEQILAAHSTVEGLSELPDITRLARAIPDYPAGLAMLSAAQLAQLGAEYIASARARQRTDGMHIVDKFPGNAAHIALIHLILPNARIIDVRRDPRDCCVSLFSQSFAAGQGYSYDLGTLGRHYRRYEGLMRHVDAVLPGRIMRVSYEALVDDLEGEVRRLFDHCGLDFEPATLRFFDRAGAVRTASSEQVRQPIYRSSIGRWRRFAAWLGPLDYALAEG